MKRILLPAAVVALSLAGGAAQAQGFLERLFGLVPSQPAPPPAMAPPAPAPSRESARESGGSAGLDEPVRRERAAPAPARPVAIRPPSEDSVIGKELKQHGTSGRLQLERTPRSDLRMKLSLVGRRAAQSVETCTVELGGPDGVPLVAQGKPEGVPRYASQDPACPLQVEILDEAVLVKGPAESCTFQAAQCQADPSGLWGPAPSQLVGRARDYEQARGSADKAVRDNYKVLTQRAGPQNVRPIVAEQAAFSSDREMICKNYAREGAHSFCNSRVTEARALSLATRLGVTVASTQPPTEVRIRRRPDPYGIPPTEELMQQDVAVEE